MIQLINDVQTLQEVDLCRIRYRLFWITCVEDMNEGGRDDRIECVATRYKDIILVTHLFGNLYNFCCSTCADRQRRLG